jgi:hypothetical protein
LAFDVDVPEYTSVAVLVPLCANPGVTADVTELSFYVYADGPTYPGFKDLALLLDENGGQTSGGAGFGPVSKTWVQVSRTFASATANYFSIGLLTNAAWKGTIYIDQVSLTPG